VEEMSLEKVTLNQNGLFLKITAFVLMSIIVISSTATIFTLTKRSPEKLEDVSFPQYLNQPYKHRTCEVSSVYVNGDIWTSFDPSEDPGTPAEVFVTVSDTSGLTLVADFFGFWRGNFTADGSNYYDTIDMPGTSSINDVGKPMLPQLIEYVEIPHDVNISLEVISVEKENVSGYEIRPAPIPVIPVENVTAPTLIFDEVYQNATAFPYYNAETIGNLKTESMIIRGRRLLEVKFFPVQFYSLSDQLDVFSQIVIRLNYDVPTQTRPVAPRLRADLFDSLLSKSLLNFLDREIPRPQIFDFIQTSVNFPGSAEYLIITVDEFLEDVQRLARWKNRKGVLTEIRVIEAGTTASEIKDLIKNAYDNWHPAPTFVLLFGDCEFIPTNYEFVHTGTYESECGIYTCQDYYYYQGLTQGGIGSDLPYFTVDGNDFFPDIFYGRISVNNALEAETIVNKILAYEKNPPLNDAFYKNILSSAFFEDKLPHDHREDWGYEFVYHADEIRSYLNDLGYVVHTNYSAYIDSNHPNLPERYNQETGSYYIPNPDFWINASKFHFDEAVDNITANFNAGRFLVYHLDHAGSKNMIYSNDFFQNYNFAQDFNEGWAQPHFNDTDLPNLSNGDLLPLVINIDCNTGWFDGETDRSNPSFADFSQFSEECFAENITRMEGGAIAVIAASRISYNTPSFHLLNGIIQAFWPGLLDVGNEPIYEMGAALVLGKLYTAREMGIDSQGMTETTFQIFHLFGDPETQLWTGNPLTMDVDYPAQISAFGRQRFVVNVSESGIPVPYAKVCLQKDNDIQMVGYTNYLGQVVFNIQSLSYIGKMNITVTKHNYRPHVGEIVVLCGGASVDVRPDRGVLTTPVDFVIDRFFPTEDVEIYIDNTLVATLSSGSTYVTDFVPAGGIGFVNVIAIGLSSGQVASTVFKRLYDNPSNDVYIYSQFDSSTWHLSGGYRTWDNPCFTIYNENGDIIQPNELQQLGSYNVCVTVYNQGDGDATYTEVSLSYSRFGGGLSWKESGVDYIAIPSGESRQVNISFSPVLEGPYCLKVKIYDAGDENERNNVGQENINVLRLASPGESNLFVGIPPDKIQSAGAEYVCLIVRQLGSYIDVWNASILDYSSQTMSSGTNESVTLQIDPVLDVQEEGWRMFSVDMYVNGELVGGVSINATKQVIIVDWLKWLFENWMPLTLGSAIGVVATLVVFFISKIVTKGKNST